MIQTKRNNYRDFKTEYLTRSEKENEMIIEGYFALYDQETELWEGAREIIRQGAFHDLIGKDIRALWNHNTQYVLGRTCASTLALTPDERGLFARIKLPETSYAQDLYELIKRGDVDQCSFGFNILDEDIEELPNGGIRWAIKDIELFEISVVTFPAYENTSVEARKKDFESINKGSIERTKQILKKRLEAIKC